MMSIKIETVLCLLNFINPIVDSVRDTITMNVTRDFVFVPHV